MKNITLTLLILSGISTVCWSQEQSRITAGYYGDVIFSPGIKLSYEKGLKSWINKTKTRSILLGGEFISYHKAGLHNAIILGPTLSYHRSKENGRFVQWKLYTAVHQSFLDGVTYEVSADDKVSEKKLNGQTTWFNSFSFLFGKQLNKRLGYYAELGINARFPYNNSLLTGIHTSIGIQYSIL